MAQQHQQETRSFQFSESLQLLELFREREYTQGRPHLYFKSLKTGQWIRPKGLRVLSSSESLAFQHWESEEWEEIPLKDMDFGLW